MSLKMTHCCVQGVSVKRGLRRSNQRSGRVKRIQSDRFKSVKRFQVQVSNARLKIGLKRRVGTLGEAFFTEWVTKLCGPRVVREARRLKVGFYLAPKPYYGV
jgi:hypothetical protein